MAKPGAAAQTAKARTAPATDVLSFTNLPNCVEDSRRAFLDSDPGPADPTNFHDLRGRLEASRLKLPPLYRETAFTPYVGRLDELGPNGFTELLLQDPERERAAGLALDIAHTILQNGEAYQERATDAFQEVVSDLYDGFLSAEDRAGVKLPDESVVPALVKWGRPDFGPYTWTISATANFGLECAVVNLPPSHGRLGLMGWAALGHETAGHDVLHADTGLRAELTRTVRKALQDHKIGKGLPNYWADRIDETASDVLGILNMGPAAAIGLIGYFRGLNAAFGGAPVLRNNGPAGDSHPADILRGFLAASTVRLLEFKGANDWADAVATETARDVTEIRIAGERITEQEARDSAEVVARALVRQDVESLENHAMGDIQDWRDQDEEITQELRRVLLNAEPLRQSTASGMYAAHVVAAAVTAALTAGADIAGLFDRMITVLKAMHDANPSWGPMFLVHRGDVSAHRAYIRTS